ncbi:hypothetical protein MKX01_035524 [Papaver californicum]|nr:hypothetical protein MKX01_035524 [Papaver californicum]
MSRESTWLLRKLGDSYSSSPSCVKDYHKILEIVLLFISKCEKTKDEILDDFGKHIKDLQEQGVGGEPVTKMLLGCFGDAVSKGKLTMDIERAGTDAAEETLELIHEAVEKLNSVRCCALTGTGSPLGNITYWRILFESSLINLRLHLICNKYGETTKLGLHASIDILLTFRESVLVEFVSIEDALNDLSRENDEGIEMVSQFPCDKHCVLNAIQYDLNDPNIQFLCAGPTFYGPDSVR